jgi:hypothetical protein
MRQRDGEYFRRTLQHAHEGRGQAAAVLGSVAAFGAALQARQRILK